MTKALFWEYRFDDSLDEWNPHTRAAIDHEMVAEQVAEALYNDNCGDYDPNNFEIVVEVRRIIDQEIQRFIVYSAFHLDFHAREI